MALEFNIIAAEMIVVLLPSGISLTSIHVKKAGFLKARFFHFFSVKILRI